MSDVSAITTVQPAEPKTARLRVPAWLRPSLLDCLCIALLIWLVAFTAGGGSAGLLQDAGTGCHVRVGDFILHRHAVPRIDVFSFTRSGQPWYAWEWLSGVLFAALNLIGGLKAIVLFSAALITATIAVLVRHMVWRGANALVVLFLVHVGIAVSSLHFLARPHLFTFFFMAVSLYVIDRDRRVYLLVPLSAVWANLHGGFIALPASLLCLSVGHVCGAALQPATGRQVALRRARRYATVAGACLLASGLNPYGFAEHLHIARYMNAAWIRQIVLEFQGPRFEGMPGLYAEVLVLGAAMLALRLAMRGDIPRALLLGLWLHAGLQSVRHLPVLAVVALPLAAGELEEAWQWLVRSAQSGALRRTLDSIASDYTEAIGRISVWPAIALALFAATNALPFPTDFPEPRYPVSMVTRYAALLANSRVFSTDSTGDYLTWRLYPYGRVFIDGRSDMYGPRLADEYMTALNGARGWEAVLHRYSVNTVLLPPDAALCSLLRRDARWKTIEDGRDFSLFQRRRFTDIDTEAP